jgi:hypothetical protein
MVDPAKRPFDDPRLGNTAKSLICLSLRRTRVMETRLASKAARCASSPM